MNTKVTMHFTIEELCASTMASKLSIPNKPGAREMINLVYLAAFVLEPLRQAMGRPISISSGYRCEELNSKVGGVSNSQHLKGQAADICINGDMSFGRQIFDHIRKNMDFDQLIWEHDRSGTYWVHVSFVFPDFGKNRKNVINNLEKK